MTTSGKRDVIDQKRWAAYAAAGAASALVCQVAEAGIVHVTVNFDFDATAGPGTSPVAQGFAVGPASSASIAFLHAVTGSYGQAQFGVAGAGGKFVGFSGVSTSGGVYPYARNLAAGQNVSTAGGFLVGSGFMASYSGYLNSEFTAPGIGFLGFQFNGGTGVQYGWARVDMGGAPLNSFELVDYAWGDVGESIRAGQTVTPPPASAPVPGSLGLLAAGAAGLALTRRRRLKPA